ncbi:hypothetical protein BCR37DRAFT_377536 [Protomyces lactucae-debilis]|uniref:Uncharacterized protein n=1 Tax=Protomyces lactucae-debilis TaxID=2754530 RepID=A0A1Y2FLH3_PROLT|nr:uncharacterized protein BCR37DRAFT_377536 [Protomyces lactucae-debilis]ORY84779.1 hypothetical protein BCR37DRAFT_377536 [Protomyces lactucae-debilis]
MPPYLSHALYQHKTSQRHKQNKTKTTTMATKTEAITVTAQVLEAEVGAFRLATRDVEAIMREASLETAAMLASISRMETAICTKNNISAGPPVISTPLTSVSIPATPPSSPLLAVCVLESLNSGRTPSSRCSDWCRAQHLLHHGKLSQE